MILKAKEIEKEAIISIKEAAMLISKTETISAINMLKETISKKNNIDKEEVIVAINRAKEEINKISSEEEAVNKKEVVDAIDNVIETIKNKDIVNKEEAVTAIDVLKENISKINISDTIKEWTNLKVKYLGKKSELSSILKSVGKLEDLERKEVGRELNEVFKNIKNAFDVEFKKIKEKEMEQKIQLEKIDVTLPGKKVIIGKIHPISKVLNRINDIFISLGFSIVDGPEIETDYYNFEALNIPKDHPARNTQDTFYISENLLLRSQTSPVQIHTMQNSKPPIKILSPGRVYRADATDATHSPVFHQVEGLLVDKDISMANLKAILELFIKNLYSDNVKVRFRPHHFPFTEPSAEMDISCFKCGGSGCPLCKYEGFIEVLGCGMVHENVLKNCNINPEIYSGFAFGLGLERIVMMLYGITDLRLFYENDMRFLKQF